MELQELYAKVQDMLPGPNFDNLIEQVFYGAKIYINSGISWTVYDPMVSGKSPKFFPVRCFSTDDYLYGLLTKFLPEKISVGKSWMRFGAFQTYSVCIDDRFDNTKDVIYVEGVGNTEAFAMCKALLLWKIKQMIRDGEKFNQDEHWYGRNNVSQSAV